MVYSTFMNLEFSESEKVEILRKLGYSVEEKFEEVEHWKGCVEKYPYWSVSKDGQCFDDKWANRALDRMFEVELKKKMMSLWD